MLFCGFLFVSGFVFGWGFFGVFFFCVCVWCLCEFCLFGFWFLWFFLLVFFFVCGLVFVEFVFVYVLFFPQCSCPFLQGANINSSCSGNLHWGSDLPDRLAVFMVDSTGFTGGSNLVADLNPISAHGNFWSLTCLVTTTSENTEVRAWHYWLCKWFFLVYFFRNGQLE